MTEAHYPDGLLYHPDHDWARVGGEFAVLGVTWYAQDALGEIVFVGLPNVNTTVKQGEAFAEVESVKAVSDVIAPLSGEIVDVNAGLGERPDLINTDPYGEGWIVRVRLSDPAEREQLLDADRYEATLQ